MSEYVIRMSKKDMILFAASAGIIMFFSIVSFVAMTNGNGRVVVDFNRFYEGWFEAVFIPVAGIHLFYKTWSSKRHDAT